LRVLHDILPLQSASSRHRGIGRYTAKALGMLLEHSPKDQAHILLANGHVPRPDLICEPNVQGWRLYYGDLPLYEYHANDWKSQLAPTQSYWQGQINTFQPDVFHIHHYFEWDATAPHGRYDGTATVATVYDLIPLRMSAHYLRDAAPWLKSYYEYVCRWLERVDQIITISEFSREDIVDALRVPRERVSVALPGPSEVFLQPPQPEIMNALRVRFGLPEGFVLVNTGYDYRKNLPRTLEAYSRLHGSLRAGFPLVITCALRDREERELRMLAADLGISGSVILTNYVSDPELVALYHMATVQFFPSLYEGFGLPVLDAMVCGLPVITSNVSSMPEVAGDAGILVDPSDTDAMADALDRVLQDESLRQAMRARGLERAASFRWEAAAEAFAAAYEIAASRQSRRTQPPRPARQSLRQLALVSPYPPQLSGVADFAQRLLTALGKHVQVTPYTAPEQVSQASRHLGQPAISCDKLHEHVRTGQVDAVLYQVGNSPFHRFQWALLQEVPGIVELHDGVLHGLVHAHTLAEGDTAGYGHELSFAHAEDGREFADQVVAGRVKLPFGLYERPVVRRAINHAIATIAHNNWAADVVGQDLTNQPVTVIPLPWAPEENPLQLDTAAAMDRLNLSPDLTTIATFGRLSFNKRLDVLVRAFARLHREMPQTQLLLVGPLDAPMPGFDIPRLVDELRLGDAVRVTGYIDANAFLDYVAAATITVNLRFPHAGETSATLTQLLGAGKPIITSSVGPFLDLPDACCWKVDVDMTEEELLYSYLLRLVSDEPLRREMGRNAARYAQTRIPRWDTVAQQYLSVIEEALATQSALVPASFGQMPSR
jgi:glycosyltransferase involved in cell wall biosynthesis